MKTRNRVDLIGYVGADAERRTVGGAELATFSVATTVAWTDERSGERRELTDWHRVECWGKLAEWAGTVARKGAPVVVEGRLSVQTWEKDGEKRRDVVVRASDVIALETRAEREARGGGR